VGDPSESSLGANYPGDAYVDWISMDGYNWGGNPGHVWQTLQQVFKQTYTALTALSGKPLMISEIGSAEQGGSKASWITSGLLTTIPQQFPKIRAVLWYDAPGGVEDWRVNSSSSSLAAFQQVAASATYHAPMP
jgi:beta-mannanase